MASSTKSEPAPDKVAPAEATAAAQQQQQTEDAAILDVTDRLNAQARRLAAKKAAGIKPTEEDYGCVQMVNEGRTVFKHRYWWLMYAYWGYTLYGLLSAPSVPFLLVRDER